MSFKLSSVPTDYKIKINKNISGGGSFNAYGNGEIMVNNFSYIGHFIAVYSELHSFNYILYRRCTNKEKLIADEEYFLCKNDDDKRKKAMLTAISYIESKNEISSDFKNQINEIYDDINFSIKSIFDKNFKIPNGYINGPLYVNILGMPGLESYEKNILDLPLNTAILYAKAQRLADLHDRMAIEYQWNCIIENNYS